MSGDHPHADLAPMAALSAEVSARQAIDATLQAAIDAVTDRVAKLETGVATTPPPPVVLPPPGPPPSAPINVTNVANLVIEGKVFTLPIGGSDFAVWIHGGMNVTIRNCTFKGGRGGVRVERVTNLVVENCLFEDIDYCAIGGYSVLGASIQTNTIRRVGVNKATGFQDNNAYGITFDRAHTGNLTTDPLSTDLDIGFNWVADVPMWMGINLHAGRKANIHDNHVEGCPRAIFVAGDGDGNQSGFVKIDRNEVIRCVTKPGGTTDKESIEISGLVGTAADNLIRDNKIGSSFPSMVFDYQGASKYTQSGNVRSGT